MSSTLPYRAPLSDSTNSNSNSNPKLLKTKHPRSSLSWSRKSSPTLTISLANVNASCMNTCKDIVSSSPSSLDFPHQSQHINIIPFPSSSESVSESDSLALLRSNHSIASSSTRSYQFRPRTSQAENRRRRSNVRISQLIVHHPSIMNPAATKKLTRRSSKRLLADLRFLSIMQRSMERNLVERGVYFLGPEPNRADEFDDGRNMKMSWEAQDRLLVRRLREYLINQGYQGDDLPTPTSTPAAESNDIDMDVDAEHHSPLLLDAESMVSQSDCSSLASLPSISSFPSTPPGLPNRVRTLSMSQLVAALIFRHKNQSTLRVRSTVRPQPAAGTRTGSHTRRSSPLALCEL